TNEQVAQAMSAADVVLAPFVESSGSGSLAMALACGKPIVASAIEPHQEMQREQPGLFALAEADNPTGFAKGIMDLRDNQELMSKHAKLSHYYAKAHSYAHMAEQTVELYKRVL